MQSQNNNFQTEITFNIASVEELTSAFRKADQKKLILPASLQFPFNVRSYFTWQEPSGVYTYLIFKRQNWDLPRGVAFKRTPLSGDPTGGLCNWCHSYGSSEEIGMLSVAMNANVSYSYFICQDLRCIEKIEETDMRAGKSSEKHIEELYYKMEKLFERISSHKPD